MVQRLAATPLNFCSRLRGVLALVNTWRHSPSMRAIELDQPLAQADVGLGVLEVAVRRAAQLVGGAVLVDHPRDLARVPREVGRERVAISRSIGWPLLDDRSSSRHAAACASSSAFGCARNGSATFSTS